MKDFCNTDTGFQTQHVRSVYGCFPAWASIIAICFLTVGTNLIFGTATAATFIQSAPITINDNAPAIPYPSTNVVSGVMGTVTKVTVTLSNISHAYPGDLDILLVGPSGQNVMLMSSAGGAGDITNGVLTFDSTAAQAIPSGTQITNGTFRPADYGTATLAAPAPVPPGGMRPYSTNLSVFNGINPNGTWQLFVCDHEGEDMGSIGSWGLEIFPDGVQSSFTSAYTFTTWAGRTVTGSADGIGDAAQFNGPSSIVVGSSGALYITDSGNSTIRKVTEAGAASTICGLAGAGGADDGTGSNARFSGSQGIAADSFGNLYVADTLNSTIRMITPTGVVSTIAGLAGSSGSSDGVGSNSRFFCPRGIAVDNTGNLYVADTSNNIIRKITLAGTNWVVSTIAGLAEVSGSTDGTGSIARFFYPQGITVDGVGNIYVADTQNYTIRKVTSAGVVSTLAGSTGISDSHDGTGSDARFGSPRGIAVDSIGNLYVVDTSYNTIRKVTLAGTNWVVSTVAGMPGINGTADGTGSNARFNGPQGIAVDSSGNLYVADYYNHTIRKITSASLVSTLAGTATLYANADGTGGNARFWRPEGIAVDSACNLYVADILNGTIRKITSAGVVSTLAGLAGTGGSADGTGSIARFFYPRGVAVDSTGNVFVTDGGNSTIRKITSAGVVSTIAGLANTSGSADGTGSDARFSVPQGIAVDNAGNVYVADTLNHTIRKITLAGTNWMVSTIAGLAEVSGSTDGAGSIARFFYPHGITVDEVGNIYVTDTWNSTVRKISSAGVVSTFAGLAGSNGSADGSSGVARFSGLKGIAADKLGNLYVTDARKDWTIEGSDTIRMITSVGVVTTLAGLAGHSGSVDGTGLKARFDYPCGIAVDSTGILYVADTLNNTIRKGSFTQYSPISSVPYNSSPMNGHITVTLIPPQANGQWRFPWEFGWHSSGTTASNLVAGNYPIEFRSLSGWLAVPFSGPVTLGSGEAVAVTNQYYPTLSSVTANSGGGLLTVNLGVNPPSGAGWRFLGDATPFLASGTTTNLPAGTYLIEFAPVNGRAKPSSQTIAVQSGQPTYVSVSYLLVTTPGGNFYLPYLVPTNQLSEESLYPFGFNGQLQSDLGYGSGVAVANNVVLTAAHLVFNDQSLSYVSRAHWLLRRDAGVSEPLPQAARGYYLLSGYAAQRTNDLQSGYSPDQSTPPSRNVDVAALYFLQPVAGGGHGGYLPSDAVPNTWLTSTALKMLVGYPVDGSQFGVNVVPGKMYQTDPQPYPLGLATDPVPGQQQVYTAPWFLSYPGNSGGPLYVQLNGQYYPAAVYLGTLFSSSTPYASIVRAIDSDVVRLITNAASMGDSGTNNTGGGVITIIPSQSISANNPGYLQLHLGPSSAVQAGAGWRLQGDPTFSYSTNYTRLVSTTNALTVEFQSIAGWNLPISQSVTVLPGQLTSYGASYTVVPPVMLADPTGIRITGTPNTTYRIERMNVGAGATQWTGISTNTLAAGTNTVVNLPQANPSAALYRAVWLPSF